MKIRNVEYFIKEFTLGSGERQFEAWVRYEEKGLIWGWNKQEFPLCYHPEVYKTFRELSLNYEIGSRIYAHKFNSLLDANTYINNYKDELKRSETEYINNSIIQERIIKHEEMNN